ncbi:MAG: nucleotide-binding protein [Myxococcales bacterium]|nr:nucleotide-binding protein [Myxococcales bacterium]
MRVGNKGTVARSVALAALMTTGLSGCKKDEAPAGGAAAPSKAAPGQAAMPPGHPPTGAGKPVGTVKADGQLTGTVQEAMNVAGYTYLKLSTPAGEKWAAVDQTQATVGSAVTVVEATEMRNFHSKTLDRTFESIYFGRLAPGGAVAAAPGSQPAAPGSQPGGALPPGHPPTSQPAGAAGGHAKPEAPAAGVTLTTPRPEGVDDIATLWSKKGELAGKPVKVHGKVTKFSPGIMGRNWVHVQDGTGDAAQNTHDLTLTTAEQVSVGQELTFEGTAQIDKDFGAGYRYGLIIEGAKVVPAK